MPFSIRRVKDGWWLKKTTNRKEFVEDPLRASTWGRECDAVSALRTLSGRTAEENAEVEVCEMEMRIVRIKQRMRMEVDAARPWKSTYKKVSMERATFRWADDE